MLLPIAYTESFVMLAGIPCQTVLIIVLIWPGMAFGTSGSGLNIVRIFLKKEIKFRCQLFKNNFFKSIRHKVTKKIIFIQTRRQGRSWWEVKRQ